MNNLENKPILIIGFGSIGRRHLRNLKTLGYKNFVLLRTGKSTLPDDEITDIPTENNLNKALAHKPIATIIANPTSLHIKAALAAAKAGSHLFLEKPISHNLKGLKKLEQIVKDKNLIVGVGYQFRFHPEIKRLKNLLTKQEIGKVLSVQAHWGEYLPDWHPWEDYKNSYAAKKELGGGVILTLSHPIDYLHYLFGNVENVVAFQNQDNDLQIDVESNVDLRLKFKSGLIANIHLDYLQKPPQHYLQIIGQKEIIDINFLDPQNNFDRNQMYIDEMVEFLSCISSNEQPLCSLSDGVKSLKIALAAKKSAQKQ